MQAFEFPPKVGRSRTVPTPTYLRRPLEVLVVADRRLYAHLESTAEGAGVHLTLADEAPAAYKQASNREHDLVLLEWGARSDDTPLSGGANELLDRLLAHSRSPIVLYTSLTASTGRSLLHMERLGVSGVAFRGVDDVSEDALRHVLYEADAAFVAIAFARSMIRRSGRWSRRLRETMAHALLVPSDYRSVDAISIRSHLTRRSVDRCCARSGLATGATLLRCARTALAYGRLRFGLDAWDRLAGLTGAGSTELLLSDIRLACNFESPVDLGTLPTEDVLRRLEATALIGPAARSVGRPV